MNLSLKHILTAFVAIGVLSMIYVLGAAMLTPSSVDSSGFETSGDMEKFVIVSERPDFSKAGFMNDTQQIVQIDDFRGRVVLVNLWATWCAPCLVEMPALDRLQETLGGDDFEVVAISLDKNADKAREWLKTNEIDNLAFYTDERLTLHADFGAKGLPTSYLIDPKGRLIGYLEGDAAWDAADAETLIEHFINKAKN